MRAHAESLRAWAAAAAGERDVAVRLYRRALELLPAGETPTWADNAVAQLVCSRSATPRPRSPPGATTSPASARAACGPGAQRLEPDENRP